MVFLVSLRPFLQQSSRPTWLFLSSHRNSAQGPLRPAVHWTQNGQDRVATVRGGKDSWQQRQQRMVHNQDQQDQEGNVNTSLWVFQNDLVTMELQASVDVNKISWWEKVLHHLYKKLIFLRPKIPPFNQVPRGPGRHGPWPTLNPESGTCASFLRIPSHPVSLQSWIHGRMVYLDLHAYSWFGW